MRRKTLIITFLLSGFLMTVRAQDRSTVKKSSLVKTIRDIPHETFREKLLWPHRSVTFQVTKERPVKYDTAYIKSNYKRVVITLPLSSRFLQFSLIDHKSGHKLVFSPTLQSNIGLSISSRWASFILNSGVKVYSGDESIKGKTEFQDYQLNLFGRKTTTDMFVQYYKGFYIKNSRDYSTYSSDKPYAIRSDVYAIHMGVSTYYILNHKRFSYGSSFAFVEQQKKKAGSLLIGIYYSYFNVSSDSSLISQPFRYEFDTTSLIRGGQTHDFGINLGYIYTLVFLKKFQATASVVQGFGGKHLAYRYEDGNTSNRLSGGAGKLHLRLAVKYDTGRYFVSAMGMLDYFLFSDFSSSSLDYSFGKVMICTGYRFSVLKKEKKLLRKLKLVDY